MWRRECFLRRNGIPISPTNVKTLQVYTDSDVLPVEKKLPKTLFSLREGNESNANSQSELFYD